MTDQNKHLAVQANINSMKYAMEKNKEAWLNLFDDNAVVSDPVGKSPLDPEGLGHKGKEKITLFWDNVIANGNVKLNATKRYTSGDLHCAVAIEGRNDMGFVETHIDMMVVYQVNLEGKIISLSAHWDFDDLMAQIKAAQE
jgi:hypothetical protein